MNTPRYLPSPTLSELNARLALESNEWGLRKICPACNSPKIRKFTCIRSIHYARCEACGFTFTNPAPAEEVISDFYNSAFYDNYRILEEDRIKEQPYFSVSAYTDLRRLAGWLDCDQSARILDFGCGPGSFLALLRDEFRFQNVEGLELNKESSAIARRNYGLAIVSDVDNLKYKEYDVIILFEVIEHLVDLDGTLSRCSNLLKHGGILFITTPSVRNIPARFFPSYCGHYTGPSHVSLFTEKALACLLARFGFSILRLEVDRCDSILGSSIASPLYHLDFASPRSSTDTNDILFVPTKFGQMLGLEATRKIGPTIKMAQRVDRLLARSFAKVSKASYSDHLYAIAHKTI